MFTEVQILITWIRAQLNRLHHDEGGYTTEFVVGTAVVVAMALAVLAILYAKLKTKANGIDLGG